MIGIIIQARTGSTRLPNKMILPFYNSKNIVEIIIDKLKGLNLNIPIILATTTSESDDILYHTAIKNGIKAYKGSENNVLERFIKAGEKYNLNKIIRICADNPLFDTQSIAHLIKKFNKSEVDYWCYATNEQTPTIKTHYGFWAEGVKLKALKRVSELTSDIKYLEHVTNYVYTNTDIFSIHYETIESYIQTKNIRLTIDTINDFKLVQSIYAQIKENSIEESALSITRFVSKHPDWMNKMEQEIKKNNK